MSRTNPDFNLKLVDDPFYEHEKSGHKESSGEADLNKRIDQAKVTLLNSMHACPCCGFNLDFLPYKSIPERPQITPFLKPPYSDQWGEPSLNSCPCCGYLFGFDDEYMRYGPAKTFARYLREWIIQGANWFKPDKMPKGWSLRSQLDTAGIKPPEDFEDLFVDIKLP